jgi:hypothetical protein
MFSTPDRELLAPLSVPILIIPFATSWISRFLLLWSLAVLLFTTWRLTRSGDWIQLPTRQQDRSTVRRVLCRLAFSTTAIDLLPALWIATLWVVERSARGLLRFDFVRQAITRAPSSSLMGVLFWLILFGLVAVLIQTSRRTY